MSPCPGGINERPARFIALVNFVGVDPIEISSAGLRMYEG